ncbi:cyclase family protein [Achromobacter sp. GG226]|uniref:cyclase family protein n=1 Tax=Verticiella alkaliphila TaxID=2779529 RepID=UPI001C0DF4EA|nr:cyclase family protein [Verticiella sp. GG226]MBU4611436.1 cyclase family protein [Verticiella sp. GG226]
MRWKQRPEGSNWGDFGEDDQRGCLNWITPEAVRYAASLIQTGERFCLSLPLDLPGGNVVNPRRHPPRLTPTERDGDPYLNFPMGRLRPGCVDVLSDDNVTMSLQYSTQWDSLAHVGALFDANGDGLPERVYYNGFRPNEHIQGPVDYAADGSFAKTELGRGPSSRATRLDITNLAESGMQGRGVLIDLARRFGREGHSVGYDELMRILDEDRIEIRQGDILLFHTEYGDALLEMNGNPDPHRVHEMCAGLDGSDERLLQWITESRIAAMASDNHAVETYPVKKANACCAALPLHHHCLFKLGLPLGEMWYLGPLARWLHAHRRHDFFLTAPPLNLPGAVGSPVTPIATV